MMKYISVLEYLGQTKYDELNDKQIQNMNTLIPKVNDLLEKFGSYRSITSGFRKMEDHIRIYKEKLGSNYAISKVPMGSQHLNAFAVDLEDTDGKLDEWCLNNLNILEKIGLWLESPDHTEGWCHLQGNPPKSKKRIFIP